MFEGEKQELCNICRMLFERRLVNGTDGNISMRIDNNMMLITPSGVNKGILNQDMILVQKFDGTVIEGNLRSSKESRLHTKIYRDRNDINAVMHTHPAYTTAFAACGIPVPENVLIEVPVILGKIAVAPYGQPGTDELVKAIDGFVGTHDIILLQNHGVLVYSSDLTNTFNKFDALENAAKSIIMAKILGDIKYIPEEELMKIR